VAAITTRDKVEESETRAIDSRRGRKGFKPSAHDAVLETQARRSEAFGAAAA